MRVFKRRFLSVARCCHNWKPLLGVLLTTTAFPQQPDSPISTKSWFWLNISHKKHCACFPLVLKLRLVTFCYLLHDNYLVLTLKRRCLNVYDCTFITLQEKNLHLYCMERLQLSVCGISGSYRLYSVDNVNDL